MVGTMVSDEMLVTRVAQGDREAFDALVERHLDGLSRFASLTCGSLNRAEDALKEGLLVAWQHAGAIPRGVSPKTWLFKIIVETCHRSSVPTRQSEQEEASPMRAPLALPSQGLASSTVASLSCEEVQARISEYIDDDLPFEDRAEMERHLRACAECRLCKEEIKATVESLHAHLLGRDRLHMAAKENR